MNYFCCEKRRRNAIAGTSLNGIDFLEVLDHDAPADADRQRFLFVRFVNPLAPAALGVDNVRIEGGERIRDIAVTAVTVGLGPDANLLTVEVDEPGDFSVYTLRIVRDADHPEPPADFDPMLSAIDFSFKVECPTDFDCAPVRVCPPKVEADPAIDYLAKDYASFRRLMLDRMSAIMPRWRDRNPADLGIALVELLSVAADHLSYQQDAVATEAYLGTARRRVSVRRHARMVDYSLFDGANARAWVGVEVGSDVLKLLPDDPPVLPPGTPLATRLEGRPVTLEADASLLAKAGAVFETVHGLEELYAAHNRLPFYTWSDQECCLPRGATQATLRGHFPNLRAGDVLLFEEVLGPRSGEAADADPLKRHAVRLSGVVHDDESGDPLVDPIQDGPQITEIAWGREDALPFAICISSRTDPEHGRRFVEDVSVARGNIVLADHGLSISDEPLGTVPAATLFRPPAPSEGPCARAEREPLPARFRPVLQKRPLTHVWPYDEIAAASLATKRPRRGIVPAIALVSTLRGDTKTWQARSDLLNSTFDATEFVAEIESDGTVYIRFGDDDHGERPEPGGEFVANYRVGNGSAGNIGAEALVHIVSPHSQITRVRNPLPATGGAEPESIDDARKNAPEAFRVQQRAVTAADYAEVTERNANVQRAAASFRWTGSWNTVFVTVDRLGGLGVDEPFRAEIRDHVEPFRMAGYDVDVNGPRFVSLELEMGVCVHADYFRSDVRMALEAVLGSGISPDGRRGLFHPDNFSFGQTVNLSRVYAAAHSVDGVHSVHITKFQRQGLDDPIPLDEGRLRLEPLEIARLDNDRNFPEHGTLTMNLAGGK
jgi:hypothetical protein